MTRYSKLNWAKRISGLLVVISFVLPLSHCQPEHAVFDGSEASVENNVSKNTNYPYDAISCDEVSSSLIICVIYFWPILALLIATRFSNQLNRKILSLFELGLSLYTAYFIALWSSIGTPQYGAVISVLGASIYFFSELAIIIRTKFHTVE